MRPQLSTEEKLMLATATQKRHLAFDHVETVAAVGGEHPAILSLYIARGRPDKWQPWTKTNHRRRVEPGVWVCPKASHLEVPGKGALWSARREIGLVENLDPEDEEAAQVSPLTQPPPHY